MTNYQNPHPTPIMKAYRKLDHKVRSQFGFHLLPPSSSTLLKRRRAPHVSALIAATRERAQVPTPKPKPKPSPSSSSSTTMPMPPKARLRGDSFWMKTPAQVSRQAPLSGAQKQRAGGSAAVAVVQKREERVVKGDKGVKGGKSEVVDRYKAELATHHASQAPSRAERERALERAVREQALPGAGERARRRRVEEEGDSYFCFE